MSAHGGRVDETSSVDDGDVCPPATALPASEALRRKLAAVLDDRELKRLSPGLNVTVGVAVGDACFRLIFRDGEASIDGPGDADLWLAAPVDAWALTLTSPPPPSYHAFTAFQLANAAFTLTGSPKLWAQSRSALERLFELVTRSPAAPAAPVRRDIAQIAGRYRTLAIAGETYDVFYEEAGAGIPVLFLHTAGADGRQYLAQVADVGLAERFRMIAVDLPFHGRSLPPMTWSGETYKLTMERYKSWCQAILESIVGGRAIVVGGSMGAAIAMVLAAECPEQILGIVGVEPPYQSKGRRNIFQNHVEVHGNLHNASFVRGLMSPTSPEGARRRASWIYAQGGPGIYPGDLAFYSEEFDGEAVAPRIDGKRTPVCLLSGTYDYSATPDDGARLAKLIPGSCFITMEGLGHFPMCEHPDLFRPYLLQGLDFVANFAGR